MPWYLCEYEPWPVRPKVIDRKGIGKYSSFIWANDARQAKMLAGQRRIGEIVVGETARRATSVPYRRPSEMLKRRMTPQRRIELIHAVCFLSFLLQRSRRTDAHTILGDEGLLHETIHAMAHGQQKYRRLRDTLRHFESVVPGYWPPSLI